MKRDSMRESQAQVSATGRDAFWRRLLTVVPLLLALLAYGIAAVLLFRNMRHFEGDEPHYVLIAESLCRDGDVDLRNNYKAQHYLKFYPRANLDPHAYEYRANGSLRSDHGLGLPILLILPHCVLGHPYWARLEMAALTALASWSIFLTIRDWTRSSRLAYATWAAVTFTVPMWTLAPQLYPDVVAVLGVAVALQLFVSRPLTPGKTLGIGLVVVLLPWLHVRFIVLSLLITMTTVVKLLRARAGWKTFAYLLLPAAIGGLLWMWNSYVLYGGILPSASYQYRSQNIVTFSWDRLYVALADIALGREFGLLAYAPVYLIALIGLVMMILRRETSVVAPLIWLLGYTLTVTLSQAVYQAGWGYYFPARLLLPAIPLLAIPLAYAIWHTRWLRIAGLALFLISMAISVQSLLQPYRALADQNGVSELPLLRHVQGILPALQDIRKSAEVDLSRTGGDTGQLLYDPSTDSQIILADPLGDDQGLVVSGPILAFQTGPYSATFTLGSSEADPSAIVARIELVADEGERILTSRDLHAHEFPADSETRSFSLSFFTRDTWPTEARVFFTGRSRLSLHSIAIMPQTELSSPSYPGFPLVVGWTIFVIAAGLLAARPRRSAGIEPTTNEE